MQKLQKEEETAERGRTWQLCTKCAETAGLFGQGKLSNLFLIPAAEFNTSYVHGLFFVNQFFILKQILWVNILLPDAEF